MTVTRKDVTQGAVRTAVGATLAHTHVVTAGTNQVLLFHVLCRATGAGPSRGSASAGGVAMTLAGVTTFARAVSPSDGGFIETWYLNNPTPGSYALQYTAGSGMSSGVGCSETLAGVAMSGPEAAASTSSIVNSTTFTSSVTTISANPLVVSVLHASGTAALTVTPTSGQTVDLDVAVPSTNARHVELASQAGPSTPGSVSTAWSFSPDVYNAAQLHTAWTDASIVVDSLIGDVPAGYVAQVQSGNGTLVFNATFTGQTPASVEVRVKRADNGTEVKAFTSASFAITGSTMKITLPNVPAPSPIGLYQIEFRTKTAGGTVIKTTAGVNTWGVGNIIGLIGSSSGERMFQTGSGTPSPYMSEYDEGWLSASSTGIGAITLANSIIAATQLPCALMDYAESSTSLSGWYLKAGSLYTRFIAAVAAAGGRVAVVCEIGLDSNGARNNEDVSDNVARYRALFSNLRDDLAVPNLAVVMWGSQRSPAQTNDANWTLERALEYGAADDANIYFACSPVDLPIGGDDVHLNEDGMTTAALRLSRGTKAAMGITSPSFRGPRPVSKTYNATTGVAVVTFSLSLSGGNSLVGRTSQTGITGFRYTTDGGSTSTVITGTITSATQVSLQLPTGLTGVQINYLAGANPDVSNCLFDNGTPP